MCAIVGLMSSRHGFQQQLKVMASKMLAEMASRGPDSSSVIELVKEGVALGHNRLAIVGGDDNSSNWWHEYSVQNGDWIRYTENSKLEFGNNLNSEVRVCKNKKCQKVLPAGYKHKYCEACRNQHAQTAKNVLKGIGAGAAAVASVAVVVVTGGKINPKK